MARWKSYLSAPTLLAFQLLLSYGFAPAPGSNPYDAAFLELSVANTLEEHERQQQQQGQASGRKRQGQQQQQQQGRAAAPPAAAAAAKRAALEARGIPDEEVFGVRLDALPEGLLEYAAFLDAPLADEGDADALAEALLVR